MGERILVVDDSKMVRQKMSYVLKQLGYDVDTAEDGVAALSRLKGREYDLVTLDIEMPKMNGIQFLRICKQLHPDLPVMMLTSLNNLNTAKEAIRLGAYDYVTKPIDPETFGQSIVRGLEHGRSRRESEGRIKTLEADLAEAKSQAHQKMRGSDVVRPLLAPASLVPALLDLARPDLGAHSRRVAVLARDVAIRMGLGDEEVRLVEAAALLHDIGLIGIPASIFAKEVSGAEMTDEERDLYRQHPERAAAALRGLDGLEAVAELIRLHHAWVDGSGFPKGVADLPRTAQIVALAEAADTYLMGRSNTDDPSQACEFLRDQVGRRFSPEVFAELERLRAAPVSDEGGLPVRELDIGQVKEGSTLAADVKTQRGHKLATKGDRLSEARIRLLLTHHKVDPICGKIAVYERP